MTEPQKKRSRLVIAGASGFIGTAVCRELVKSYDLVVLTRSRIQSQTAKPDLPVTWMFCDLYSRKALEAALAGAEYAIYLVHTRMPSSRLSQASSEDMNLLLADNFARAAQLNGVRQIIFLGGMISEENISSRLLQNSNEVEQTLASYGTPVTSIRASVVVGPGGTFVRLLSDIVLRFPVVMVPSWALKLNQPISVNDIVRAILSCLGNPETFNKRFDIGGPDIMTFTEILKETGEVLGKKRWIVSVPFFPLRLYKLWVRLLCFRTNPTTINLLVESLQSHMVADHNLLQEKIVSDAEHYRQALEACLDRETKRLLPNPRLYTRNMDDLDLRYESRVRSIQRFRLPKNRTAAWAADTYFNWLPKFVWPFVVSKIDVEGSCHFFLRFPRLHLISLKFKPYQSSENRRLYIITSGLLVKATDGRRARFEFRDVLNNRFTIGAIHDYSPRLPWYVYTSTQAVIHSFIMRAFQRYLERLAQT